jgi:uncharacterized repeat protein (TIGR01451 family)
MKYKRILALGAMIASLAIVPVAAAASAPTESADLGVTVTADKTSYKAGDLVTLTLTASNAGAADASDVVVGDILPAGATLVSVTSSSGESWSVGSALTDLGLTDATSSTTLTEGSDPTGSDTTLFAGRTKVSVVLGDLGSGLYNGTDLSTGTVTIVFQAGSVGTLVNDAVVSAANPDPYQPNNYATLTSTVS